MENLPPSNQMGTLAVLTTKTNDYRPWHPALRSFIDETRLVLAKDVWNYLRYILFIRSKLT
jgi:hypothetical protein